MKIETDGSLPAEDAVAYAARIFQDQLSLFVNFDEPVEIEKPPQSVEIEFIVNFSLNNSLLDKDKFVISSKETQDFFHSQE